MHRTPCRICEPNSYRRIRPAIGDEFRTVVNQARKFHLAHKPDLFGQCRFDVPGLVLNRRHENIPSRCNVYAAPTANLRFPISRIVRAGKVETFYPLSIQAQTHPVKRRMLDADIDRRRGRRACRIRINPFDFRRLIIQPGLSIIEIFCLIIKSIQNRFGNRRSILLEIEICPPYCPTSRIDKFRNCAACIARVLFANDGRVTGGQCLRINLYDMRSRLHIFKMVKPVLISDNIVARFEIKTNALYTDTVISFANPFFSGGTSSFSNAANNRQT